MHFKTLSIIEIPLFDSINQSIIKSGEINDPTIYKIMDENKYNSK